MSNPIGWRSGRLVVIKEAEREARSKRRQVLCKCDCGNQKVIRWSRVKGRITKSCGCIPRENLIAYNFVHGEAGKPLYRVHRNMMLRCYDETSEGYHRYGGRGITVCNEWKDIKTFVKWAKASGYRNNLTIERIDNDGDYEPNNCRWATLTEQANNRRTNRLEKYRGDTRTVAEWSRILNIESDLLYSRLSKGWSFKRAVETPHVKGRGMYQKYL